MKRFISGIMIISAALALSSCSSANGGEPSPSPTSPATAVVSPSASAAPASTTSEKPDEKTMTITYNGRVDSNFIEVLLPDGSFSTLKLSDSLKNSFDSLKLTEGSKVNIKYTETDGQKIITEFIK